jgi:hypothetical protein
MGLQDQRCRYCDSPPGIVDVARLAHALDPEGATEAQPVHATAPQPTAFHCLACGAALAPDEAMQCGQCGATLAVSQLGEAHRAVSVLEQALREHARSPAPHVRARRLLELEGDLSRRREWAREMEAEARAQGESVDQAFWEDLRERPWHVVAAAVLLFFVFWLFYR